mgnify:CR=1 FL=1
MWSEWEEFSECSVSCGGGAKSRQRYCNNPEPQYQGEDCEGDDEEAMSCNEDPCPGKMITNAILFPIPFVLNVYFIDHTQNCLELWIPTAEELYLYFTFLLKINPLTPSMYFFIGTAIKNTTTHK